MVLAAQSLTPNLKIENARKKIGHDYHERAHPSSMDTRNEKDWTREHDEKVSMVLVAQSLTPKSKIEYAK